MKKAKLFKPKPLGTGKKFSNKKPRQYDTSSWVEFRNRFIAANPKCYCCEERATVVDHWMAHKGAYKLFWNETNYIPLCKPHHDAVTGLFDRHNPPKTKEKLEWINGIRLQNGITRRVKVVTIPKEVREQLKDE